MGCIHLNLSGLLGTGLLWVKSAAETPGPCLSFLKTPVAMHEER